MNRRLKLVQLLDKYNRPGGRYSYYQTHGQWNQALTKENWIVHVLEEHAQKKSVDLYVHIPFCFSLCTFCGCNIQIKKHSEDNQYYLEALKNERALYPSDLQISSVYLGGGTPNFFSAHEFNQLFNILGLNKTQQITIEIDPRYLNREHLSIFKEWNVSHLSIGLQDVDAQVLSSVNRETNFDHLKEMLQAIQNETKMSFGFDFIYGLAHQSEATILTCVELIKNYTPKKISLYPFAKVPWQKNNPLAEKAEQADSVHQLHQFVALFYTELEKLSYQHLGMGHFEKSSESNSRSITGFTKNKSSLLIGLGVSAISSGKIGHIQNEKIIDRYQIQMAQRPYAYFKSHQKNNRENLIEIFFEQSLITKSIDLSKLSEICLKEKKFLLQHFKDFLSDELLIEHKEKNQLDFAPQSQGDSYGHYFAKSIFQKVEELF